ncbi:hypothetical protein STCU_00587 [Strigomonas culicis]|nr:hypothetical protein STCU_03282 [Strigomonas culicis]EPY36433.1 hypothetical protein STCU_00587 [Strigomonas culicis]|eukprot:EPY31743.1 hypothetical protein STCU_03282 [Strigomonas culicis]
MHVYYDREHAFKSALSCTEEVLTSHNIEHWLQNGTLLGSTRLGRLVLWDADLDIGILASSSDNTAAALADLDAQCYGSSATTRYGAQNAALRIWKKCTNRVCADFHETKIENSNVYTGDGVSASSQLLPLNSCTVADVTSFCPANSPYYLSQAFGTDWLSTPLSSLF